jgi:hypothetical protein
MRGPDAWLVARGTRHYPGHHLNVPTTVNLRGANGRNMS